jgi:predicted amidohydrolase YtcJ
VIAHTQLVHPDDRPRFAALGVVANFEPLWAQHDDAMVDLTFPRLGPERSALQYPIGTLLRSGAPVSFGSDWPVSSHRPLDGLATAVTRLNAKGRTGRRMAPRGAGPDRPGDRRLHHRHGAPGLRRRRRPHRRRPRADLVVLDRDITAIAGEEIPDARVDQTWLAGDLVYER